MTLLIILLLQTTQVQERPTRMSFQSRQEWDLKTRVIRRPVKKKDPLIVKGILEVSKTKDRHTNIMLEIENVEYYDDVTRWVVTPADSDKIKKLRKRVHQQLNRTMQLHQVPAIRATLDEQLLGLKIAESSGHTFKLSMRSDGFGGEIMSYAIDEDRADRLFIQYLLRLVRLSGVHHSSVSLPRGFTSNKGSIKYRGKPRPVRCSYFDMAEIMGWEWVSNWRYPYERCDARLQDLAEGGTIDLSYKESSKHGSRKIELSITGRGIPITGNCGSQLFIGEIEYLLIKFEATAQHID